MKMKKIYKILLLIAVCIIAVSGCKKEDKVRLSKDNYKLKKALIDYIKKFEGFRLVHE